MTTNDYFVFEVVSTRDDIIQMGVTVFVNLLFTVIRRDECHFGYQDFRAVHVWTIIETLRGGIASVSNQRDAHFVSHVGASELNIANLISTEMSEFGS